MLQADGIDARVIDMHTIKPLDEELLLRAARETSIVTTEEHNIPGRSGRGRGRLSLRRGPCARGAPRRQRRVRPLRQGPWCWSTTVSPPRGSRPGPAPRWL